MSEKYKSYMNCFHKYNNLISTTLTQINVFKYFANEILLYD